MERFFFNCPPRADRPLIREATIKKKGVYIWIGEKLFGNDDDATTGKTKLSNTFTLENYQIYVGCSFADSIARIVRYYQKTISRNRPVHRFISESGGIGGLKLVFFKISESKPVSPEMLSLFSYYFMQKLNPSLNVHHTSLVPSKHNDGKRVHVYNQSKKKLLYRFKSMSSLVRVSSSKHDTIKKHILSKTLLYGAFHVSLEPRAAQQ